MDAGIIRKSDKGMAKRMKLGIMQPYFFPYQGYFSMINHVDRFICYDDVTFIKQGWINRNRILVNGKPQMFTVPLHNVSSNVLIRRTAIDIARYNVFKRKFLKTLEQNYSKAPFFDNVIAIIIRVLGKACYYISELAVNSIIAVCDYLSINTNIVKSAVGYDNRELRAENRVIDICKKEGATEYINADGGRSLYNRDHFKQYGIDLKFLKSKKIEYDQHGGEFVPWLSILDVLMFNSIEDVNRILCECVVE